MKIVPKNEAELIFRFAQEMPEDWKLLNLWFAKFPDAELEIKAETYKIEFEYTSQNFVGHKHDVGECDLIICWIHDWDDCPLPVLELLNPGWLKTRIRKELSASDTVTWEPSWTSDPLSKIQKVQALEDCARRDKKKAEARLTSVRKEWERVKRILRKGNKPGRVKHTYSHEKMPQPTRFSKKQPSKANATEPWIVPWFFGEYRPPKRW